MGDEVRTSFGDREQVYWYTPSEASSPIWFLECWRCKYARDHARRMRDLRYIASIKSWQEWSIERRQNFEEGPSDRGVGGDGSQGRKQSNIRLREELEQGRRRDAVATRPTRSYTSMSTG